MENIWLKSIVTIMTILSCLGAILSGYYARIAGRLSKGSLAYQFFYRYSDEKMSKALKSIGKFKSEYQLKHGAEFINVWYEAFKINEQWAIDLEEDRRVLKYYYRDVATLFQSKCLQYKIAEKICSAGGVFLFMECVLPMEDKVNPLRYKDEYIPIPEIAKKMYELRQRTKELSAVDVVPVAMSVNPTKKLN